MDDYQCRRCAPGFALGVRCGEDEIFEIELLAPRAEVTPQTLLAKERVRQLRAYLKNPRFEFGLPLAPAGTPFQRRVWAQIGAIPCGQTRCYGDLAQTLKSARAPSAVPAAPTRIRWSCPATASSPRAAGWRFQLRARRPAARHQALAAGSTKACGDRSRGYARRKYAEHGGRRAARPVRRHAVAGRRPGEEHAGRLPQRSRAVRRLAGGKQVGNLPMSMKTSFAPISPNCTAGRPAHSPNRPASAACMPRCAAYRFLLAQGASATT